MKKTSLVIAATLLALLLALAAGAAWYVHTKLPVREGTMSLERLSATVTVQYDERGVPHIHADNEADLYRALGYVHAQDRLFQMEMARRLANGELAEVFGPRLLDSDKLFRTLRLREHAKTMVARLAPQSPASRALLAYLDGVNQFQATHPAPMEFDALGIRKRPFTPEDAAAVSGYLAYSFAAAFKTEPLMTFVRDKLGPQYLGVFDTEPHPEGGLRSLDTALASPGSAPAGTSSGKAVALSTQDWEGLNQLAQVSRQALRSAGMGEFQGSNAWVVSGQRTQSGKPILAGDPHIGFSVPATWYEAHLRAPGFELYGHFNALNPLALLGHNTRFGWSVTMFENDDIDLIAEKANPANPGQVWHQDQWVDLQVTNDTIKVKGAADVVLPLRTGPHGPIVTDAFHQNYGNTPIAMWWAFLETDNPIEEALYQLNRADTRDKARAAAEMVHAPGLNILWANTSGDIAWWAAAKLPQRPEGANPLFILDASKGEAEKGGFYNFSFNPQEENPARGYIVSANQQPASVVPVPGYYLLPDRAKRLDDLLQDGKSKWTPELTTRLQLDVCNDYPKRVLKLLLPMIDRVATDPNDRAFMEPLQKWDGCYEPNSVAASLFSQLSYELSKAVFEDELGELQFQNLLGTPALDHALPRLVADVHSPWWNNIKTPQKESHFETVRVAWSNTLKHMMGLYGTSLIDWTWANTHTLTHRHPLGQQKPLDRLFDVGPFAVPGGRETPNNLSQAIGPAPWAVTFGPSTRRVIDFGAPDKSLGINPVGQSGVLFDRHYSDQAERFAQGLYARQRLGAADIHAHTDSTLTLQPKP
ncbi:penicillin acylase family protein [Rhodoferax lacus]|uniref:Penicillin acylase family protein n=1 Tax=Rhodoferax lacus TaxID=2184758 RepID=A0A3E1RGD6_9BURK|nr:penicillin acylase family protein [Rhodoferax lacus]RFO98428.1 penicillin acylase family protein [Rhodoferax lacus]